MHWGVPENISHILNYVDAESLPSLEKKNGRACLEHAMKSQIVIQLVIFDTETVPQKPVFLMKEIPMESVPEWRYW